jgi:MFS family permease
MILGDLGAGIGTIVLLLSYMSGNLQIWIIYLVSFFSSFCGTFQELAFPSTISMLVDKKHYTRAQGMMSTAYSIPFIFAPSFAAFLLLVIGLEGIMMIDIVTYVFAIGVLIVVHIPQPKPSEDLGKGFKGVGKDIVYGFKYIYNVKPLFAVLMSFLFVNFFLSWGGMLNTPMILARTQNDKIILGIVMSCGAIGGLIGGIALSVWGGPKERKIRLVFIGIIILGILSMALGMGRDLFIWIPVMLITPIITTIGNGCMQAIWQSKVEANKQGRVFSARLVLARLATLIVMIIIGPIADLYFEPSMQPGGYLSGLFGWIVGIGPGAGMGLLIMFGGISVIIVGAVGYSIKKIRDVETLVPDAIHEEVKKDMKTDDVKEEKIRNGEC